MGKFSILFPLWANKRLFLSPYQFLEYVSILDGRDNIEIALGHVNSYRNMKPMLFETCYRLVPYWDAREGDIIYCFYLSDLVPEHSPENRIVFNEVINFNKWFALGRFVFFRVHRLLFLCLVNFAF